MQKKKKNAKFISPTTVTVKYLQRTGQQFLTLIYFERLRITNLYLKSIRGFNELMKKF